MKKTITAEEISKNLPMRVRSLGIFRGDIVRFDKVEMVHGRWQLTGQSVGSKRFHCVFVPQTEFELLEPGRDY
jgi:hypothetical protein